MGSKRMMHRSVLVLLLVVFSGPCYEAQQIQMPEASSLVLPEEDLETQVQALQKNITELWTYIYQLRGAISQHLNHLRQHQIDMETTVHNLVHHPNGQGDSHAAHTDDHHHHSGEHHSHSGEHHSHDDGQHSHNGEQHSHGDEQHSHSHSGEHTHSHSGEQHSHGSSGHSHDSHSHSHSHSGHGEDHHAEHADHSDDHHHHDHKDSHEKEENLQQSQQGADALVEPVVVASQTSSQSGHHHHHHHGSHTATSQPSGLLTLPLMAHHHNHHNNETRRNRSRVVIMPKYSEYDLYDFAVCNVRPNRAIPQDQQQDVTGQVSLWQKKLGGPLNIHVRLQGFNMGGHHGDHQTHQQQQEVDNETPTPIGHKHGFHIHTNGDLSNGCQSTGPHYNPKGANHGGPNALVRHVGDLGSIECDDHGVTNIVFSDDVASMQGQYSIIGKSMVIHTTADDYGLGGNDESLRTGNAGTRIACCIIEKVEKLPIRSYKAIKTATQYQN